jgi:hypothetical protein
MSTTNVSAGESKADATGPSIGTRFSLGWHSVDRKWVERWGKLAHMWVSSLFSFPFLFLFLFLLISDFKFKFTFKFGFQFQTPIQMQQQNSPCMMQSFILFI